jgi:hypothetical protein
MPPQGDFDSFILMRVAGGIELRNLIRDLKDQQRRDLRRRLNKKIRDATAPIIRDLRSAIMRVEVQATPPGTATGGRQRHPHEHDLRARVARAITTSITPNGGVRIKVSANRVGPYGASLAKYLDTEIPLYRRWRHPVFGNTNVWRVQRGQPWFFQTISQHRSDLESAVLQAIDEVRAELSN